MLISWSAGSPLEDGPNKSKVVCETRDEQQYYITASPHAAGAPLPGTSVPQRAPSVCWLTNNHRAPHALLPSLPFLTASM